MLRDVFSVRLQSLAPPRVTEIILQTVAILPPIISFKSSSGLAHFTPALKVCFMSLSENHCRYYRMELSFLGTQWLYWWRWSQNTGSIASQESQKGLVTTGADHTISKPETELSLTFGLGSRRLRRGLERVTKGSRWAIQWLEMNKTAAFDSTSIKRSMVRCA